MVRFLPLLISLVLSLYALFSCIQTRDKDVPYLPKLAWIVLIVLVPFIGPIVWLLMSHAGSARPDRGVPRGRPTGQLVAPDDDPDFLASLERYRDPRTTVRPPSAPDEPKDKVKPGGDEKPAEPVQDKVQDDKRSKSKSKDETETETEAPTESDDGNS